MERLYEHDLRVALWVQTRTVGIEFISLDFPRAIVTIGQKDKIEAVILKLKEVAGTAGLMTVEKVKAVSPMSAVAGIR